jgi:hypothetical protein
MRSILGIDESRKEGILVASPKYLGTYVVRPAYATHHVSGFGDFSGKRTLMRLLCIDT